MAVTHCQLNSNLLCAVDLRTYGPKVGDHGIFQIAVVPLDHNYKQNKTPFYTNFQPYDKTDFDPKYVSKDELMRGINHGIPPLTAADIFVRWFERIIPKDGKMIMVLVHDWESKAKFLREWLEPERFDLLFHPYVRDLLPVSLYLNDYADMKVEQIPFPKNDFRFVCTRLNVTIDVRWDCLSQAVATAEAYSRILRKQY